MAIDPHLWQAAAYLFAMDHRADEQIWADQEVSVKVAYYDLVRKAVSVFVSSVGIGNLDELFRRNQIETENLKALMELGQEWEKS